MHYYSSKNTTLAGNAFSVPIGLPDFLEGRRLTSGLFVCSSSRKNLSFITNSVTRHVVKKAHKIVRMSPKMDKLLVEIWQFKGKK
jgi:hypothetical protein